MTTYTAVISTETDPGKPVKSDLMKRVVDNPIAISEGAAGAPRIAGQALNMVLAAADVTGQSPVGWTTLDRADWIEVFGFLQTPAAGSGSTVQARLSSDNGATWSGYSSLSALVGLSQNVQFRVQINIKTGAYRYTGPSATGFASGTLAFTGSPNALQFRANGNNTSIMNLDAKILGGIA
jgi:hypothetical protein